MIGMFEAEFLILVAQMLCLCFFYRCSFIRVVGFDNVLKPVGYVTSCGVHLVLSLTFQLGAFWISDICSCDVSTFVFVVRNIKKTTRLFYRVRLIDCLNSVT